MSNIAATNHGLKIYVPDIFSLLDNVLTNAASYGLTNVLSPPVTGQSIDAVSDPNLNDISLNGPGASYIFWDPFDPSARMHEVIADYVQQYISPTQISGVTPSTGSNQLQVVNFPAGLNGFVDGITNITSTNWLPVQKLHQCHHVTLGFRPGLRTPTLLPAALPIRLVLAVNIRR